MDKDIVAKIVPGFRFYMPPLEVVKKITNENEFGDSDNRWTDRWHTVKTIRDVGDKDRIVLSITDKGFNDQSYMYWVVLIVKYNNRIPSNFTGATSGGTC